MRKGRGGPEPNLKETRSGSDCTGWAERLARGALGEGGASEEDAARAGLVERLPEKAGPEERAGLLRGGVGGGAEKSGRAGGGGGVAGGGEGGASGRAAEGRAELLGEPNGGGTREGGRSMGIAEAVGAEGRADITSHPCPCPPLLAD